MRHGNWMILGLFGTLAACAPQQPPVAEHHLSAAEYDQRASSEEQQAAAHMAQYNPGLTKREYQCSPRACWTSVVNPTQHNVEEAEAHRKAAAEQRMKSSELRDVEARDCAGMADADRDTSPFDHREDIVAVEPLLEGGRTMGATVFFRKVPGLTQDSLQKHVDCHIARNSALGHIVPEMPHCPLVPAGVSAKVRTVSGAFAVDVLATNHDTGEEVFRRAETLPMP